MKLTFSKSRAILLLLLLLCLGSTELLADVVVINYQIRLSDDFLLGQDSAMVVFQHGKKLKRLKLVKNRRMVLKVDHVITCPVGRASIDSFEGQEELRKWNGSTYNFYFPDLGQTISVPSVAKDITGRSIKADSTYLIGLNQVVPPEDEIEQSRELINDHVGRYGVFANVDLRRFLIRDPFSKIFKDCIRELDVKGFTVQELNQLLSTNLPDNGITFIETYSKGRRSNRIRCFTAFGSVKSVTNVL